MIKTDCFISWSLFVADIHLKQKIFSSLTVFVTSKSYIYLTNEVTPLSKVPQTSEQNSKATELYNSVEPIYENIETGNILPSDDNKFTIYVNYDFLSTSNVRLLEPDIVEITEIGESLRETDFYQTTAQEKSEKNILDTKTMSKTMQCQQISMYIGEFIYWRHLK